jgi:transcriptional regulator with XRE-family HTH domain
MVAPDLLPSRGVNRIGELRQARGLSQQDLATRAGTIRGRPLLRVVLQRWETGERVPLVTDAAAIAMALGVGIEDLGFRPA